ncbi:ankyrin repeat domain-containing protein [Solirubrobacter soli]|uniref:ankyrin repeat domain-containing protein n=1 Tax=Solirubrobacter soli TaxID=363832 RepID=UPI00040E51BF|nr:ankyrin repeat domain-containing protein [Solirubrobacter soli]
MDIEQARKRAKELTKAWRAAGRPGRLADAQREIARGLGFSSWPALVHHAEAEAVDRAQRVETFVDWATNGRRDRAQALLDLDPSLTGTSLDVALLVGDAERARSAFAPRGGRGPAAGGRGAVAGGGAAGGDGAARDPDAPFGHRAWAPLVYVTHSAFLGSERTDALVETARVLLDAGADPNASWQHPEFGALSALYGAAGVNNEPRMTALLLDRGANPDDGESLYHSVESRDHTCTKLLLDAGAPVANSGALGNSLCYDDLECTRLLLEHVEPGADLDGLIEFALAYERSRAHIELLLAHGAPATPKAATLAIRRGRDDLADLLGDPGDVAPVDRFIGAIRRGDRDTALDLRPGLTLTQADHDVLVHAAVVQNAPAVELMLELGFPIDVRSEQFNETALHAAAWYGHADMVEKLLAHGADPNAVAGDPVGTTLDWAVQGTRRAPEGGDHARTVELLQRAGATLVRESPDELALIGS